jgi:4-amino-4-deoxy-L-arabinose transferase-like glycosyltransferase
MTKRPWVDEGWYASIAHDLLYRGVMGMTILDPRGFAFTPVVKEIDRYTYWVMPGYIFIQVVWYKLFGLSMLTMRSISVVWAAVALVCWYYTVTRIMGSRITGLLATLVLAVDQQFVVSGATGRMDMMCSAMSLLGSALYLRLRERFHVAVFTACAILAAALMTHPNAVFGLILLFLIVLWRDRDQVRWETVLIAAVPFVVAIGLWSIYILRAPDIFVNQMQAQAKIPHRFAFDWNLYEQFKGELLRRFAIAYRLRSDWIVAQITGAPVILYFASVIGLGLIPGLRKRPGASLIFTIAVVQFTLLSCLQANWYYLVYILPAFSAAVAVCATYLWDRGSAGRLAALLAVASTVVLNTGVIGFRIVHNEYKNRYAQAVSYLKTHASPDALIVGSAELGFDLGFDGRIIDDCRMGYTSGRRADYIVLEAFYYLYWIPWLSVNEPHTFKYIKALLKDDYTKVYDQSKDPFRSMGTFDLPYQIYRRKGID